MGLNIKNVEVERLAAEVAAMAHESKTEAIRVALTERKHRLAADAGRRPDRKARVMQFLERSVWPHVRPDALGKPISKKEMEDLLGF